MMSSIENGQKKAKDAFHDVAETATSTSKDWYSRAERLLQMAVRIAPLMPGRAMLAGLERMGLRRRSTSRIETAGAFAAGLFVGGAVTALATPWSGRELRSNLAGAFSRLGTSASAEVESVEAKVAEGAQTLITNVKTAVSDGRESLADALHEPTNGSDGHIPFRS